MLLVTSVKGSPGFMFLHMCLHFSLSSCFYSYILLLFNKLFNYFFYVLLILKHIDIFILFFCMPCPASNSHASCWQFFCYIIFFSIKFCCCSCCCCCCCNLMLRANGCTIVGCCMLLCVFGSCCTIL